LYWTPFPEKQEQSIIAPMVMFQKAKHQKMISKSHLMLFNKKRYRLHTLAGVAFSSVLLVFLMGATEINIGDNNQVNTGKIIGGNCLQGNGKLIKKRLVVGQFNDILVDGTFTVNVSCGQHSEISITADENLHSLISTVVNNGKLHLSTSGSYCTTNSFVAEVSLQNLASITADGSSELMVNCSSVANGKLDIDLRGTSSMVISGRAKNVNMSLQDSTELEAFQLKAEAVTIKASDASTARVNVSQKLTGEGSDASTIIYRGHPQIVKVQTADASECSPDD
jgi:Putative auto-transporter adhesin, head GIN domain